MSDLVTKPQFRNLFSNGIQLRDPAIQKGLASKSLQGVKEKLEALADNDGHISADKLDKVFSTLDFYDRDGSRDTFLNKGKAGTLFQLLQQGQGVKRSLGRKSLAKGSLTAARSKPRAKSASQSEAAHGVSAATPVTQTEPVEPPLSEARIKNLMKARSAHVVKGIKESKNPYVKDFRKLMEARTEVAKNPEDYDRASQISLEKRLRAVQSSYGFERTMSSLQEDFYDKNPGHKASVDKLQTFLLSDDIDQLQTQREATAKPSEVVNVYQEQLQLLKALHPERVTPELTEKVYRKAEENFLRKNPQEYLKTKTTLVLKTLKAQGKELTGEDKQKFNEFVESLESKVKDRWNTTNATLTNVDRVIGELADLGKSLAKTAGTRFIQGETALEKPQGRISSAVESNLRGSALEKIDQQLQGFLDAAAEKMPNKAQKALQKTGELLQGRGFRILMGTLSGGAAALFSNNDFEVYLNTLSALDHGASLVKSFASAEPGKFMKGATTASKVLGPAVAILTTGYDAYNAAMDFSNGDVVGGVGKTLQAAGGTALLAPGIGWATGAALLGTGMIIDWTMGESDGETNVRQMLEKRVENFTDRIATEGQYSQNDLRMFHDARALSNQLVYSRKAKGAGIESLKDIMFDGAGAGWDDDFDEMTTYYLRNRGKLPPCTEDALRTIERTYHRLQLLARGLPNTVVTNPR